METRLDWQRAVPGLRVLEHEPMARHTTFRIGGPARWILCPDSREQAARVLALCREAGIVPFYLGNGSNLLVADGGYDGVILSTAGLDGLHRSPEDPDVLIAESGVSLSRLARFAADLGLTGLEFAQGIPGSVGGALRMNAGAYGGEMCQVTARVEGLDEAGKPFAFTGDGCDFGYRRSRFSESPWLITGAAFRLAPGDREAILARMAELAARRREKQPLELPSAGSTFRRPPASADGTARYAAALIDGCGLKGCRVGDAQVSEKHAGFLVNLGSATCTQVEELMNTVKEKVLTETGVELVPEVVILR